MSDDLPRNEQLVETPAPTDERLWSVTTIINASADKEALIYWAAKETAKAAVAGRKTIEAMLEDTGPDAAIEWLKGARFRAAPGQRTAKDLGTAVHHACEEYVLTGIKPEVDDEVRPFLDQFDNWCQAFQPAFQAAELTVYGPRFGFAGTLDGIARIGDAEFLLDYKTSRDDRDDRGKLKGPRPEVALQLAAYRHAEFAGPWRPRRNERFRRRYYLLGEDEKQDAVPVPKVDGGMCIYITPQRCQAHIVRCDEEVFTHFQYAIERARWSDMAESVIGEALEPEAVTA